MNDSPFVFNLDFSLEMTCPFFIQHGFLQNILMEGQLSENVGYIVFVLWIDYCGLRPI